MQINGNIIRFAILLLTVGMMGACRTAGRSQLVLDSDIWVVADSSSTDTAIGASMVLPLSIEFLNDGQLIGLMPCNSFKGSYTTHRKDSVQQIGIAIEGITLSLCPEIEREQYFVGQLKRARSYEVRNGRLLLRDESGVLLLTFVPASMTQKTNNKTTL